MSEQHKSYESDSITVLYDPARCIHAAKCVGGLPSVFSADRKPWIDPSQGEAAAIAAVVCECPTGALQYEAKGDLPGEVPDSVNTISVSAAGPLFVRGNVKMVDPITEEVVGFETRLALCRCGQTKNKPYCDDSHLECAFADAGLITEGPTGATSEDSGELHIEPLVNGPLFITGPFTLSSSDGATVLQGTKTVLCRCGASENKPFCDGSHREAGFQS